MFHGSIVALVTPMKANGDIDYPCLRKLIDWHISQQTNAIVVIGTTGESPTLAYEEQDNVIKAAIEQADGRIPIIAGTGTNCTKKTIERTRTAMEIGVDACLLVTPYYNRPTQEGLYQHYRAIAEAVPIPQILYNVPTRTGCNLLPETVARLANIPNIVGIKEGAPNQAQEIIKHCGSKIDVLSADDNTTLEIIKLGGKGVISVVANIAPKLMHDMCHAALNNNNEAAKKIDHQLEPLYKNLFIETNPIPVKWAATQMGLIPAGIRLPLTPLSESSQTTLRSALQQVGLLEV